MKKPLLSLLSLALLSACASDPDRLAAAYVSPTQYQSFSCAQIGEEQSRISRQASQLYGNLKKDADNDAAQMGVGLILFWPALFFLEGGDGPQAAEYQRLKGEYEALEQVSVRKKCGIKFRDITPPKPKEAKKKNESHLEE
ncbi:MAG: hypothetical protein AB7G80_01095 [Dongiaceae bacterium]